MYNYTHAMPLECVDICDPQNQHVNGMSLLLNGICDCVPVFADTEMADVSLIKIVSCYWWVAFDYLALYSLSWCLMIDERCC